MAESSIRMSSNSDNVEGITGDLIERTGDEEMRIPQGRIRIDQTGAVDFNSVVNSLTDFANRTGMPIVQQNGQRRYGPPMGFTGNRPPLTCEVFVGHLPDDCFEPEFIPILETAGSIFEVRLMMDYNLTSRGYCFVQYYTDQDAERAVRDLNNYEIRKGCQITVVHSTNKRTLFLRNLPQTKTPRDISYLMRKLAKGVVAVTVPKPCDHQRGSHNRGYGFIEFDSHMSAVNFLTKWCKHQVKVYNHAVTIEWAEMVPQSNSVIVYDLAPVTTDEKIYEIFNEATNNSVDRIERRADGVYIFFRTNDQAQMAKNRLNYKNIDGAFIKVKVNTISANNRITFDEHNNQFREDRESVGSSSYVDVNYNNQIHLPEQISSNISTSPQNPPYSHFNNAPPVGLHPNQNQPRLNFNQEPSTFVQTNREIPSQGIFLYGPYYPPPVYMLPIQFMNQPQQ